MTDSSDDLDMKRELARMHKVVDEFTEIAYANVPFPQAETDLLELTVKLPIGLITLVQLKASEYNMSIDEFLCVVLIQKFR